MTTRSIGRGDIHHLSGVLKRAFANDPGMRYVVPDPAEWERIATPYFNRTLRHTISHGHGVVDPGMRGLSLWETGARQPFASAVIDVIHTSWLLRQNLARALPVQALTGKARPRRPCWYLTYLATDPEHQGHGCGSAVLAPMLELATRQQLPVFLECSNRANLPFYVGHGFNIIDEIVLPQGPSIWPMVREAR